MIYTFNYLLYVIIFIYVRIYLLSPILDKLDFQQNIKKNSVIKDAFLCAPNKAESSFHMFLAYSVQLNASPSWYDVNVNEVEVKIMMTADYIRLILFSDDAIVIIKITNFYLWRCTLQRRRLCDMMYIVFQYKEF
jgi:hypothetical protein